MTKYGDIINLLFVSHWLSTDTGPFQITKVLYSDTNVSVMLNFCETWTLICAMIVVTLTVVSTN